MTMTKKRYGKTITGVEITDELVERWAAEAEAGYDPAKLRPVGRPAMGGGPAIGVHIRLEPELLRELTLTSAQEQTSASEIIRRALRAYLRRAS